MAQHHRALTREPAVAGWIAFSFGALLLFVAWPLGRVLGIGAGALAGFSFDAALRPLVNSVVLGAATAVTGTICGFAAAYYVVMTTLPLRRTFRTLALVPLIAPPFMLALSAIMLFGRNGVVTRALLPIFGAMPELYGFGGLLLVQTLTYFPTSMLLLMAIFSALDPTLEEAALAHGARPADVFRKVILPLAVPGMVASLLLLFIESLADFGNPLILGGDFRVLSVAAFLKITGEYDTAGGALLASLLLMPALLAFAVQRWLIRRTAVVTVLGKRAASRRPESARGVRSAAALLSALLALAVLLFVGSVLYGSVVQTWRGAGGVTTSHYQGAVRDSSGALFDSLLLAGLATPLTVLFGMLLAWLFVRKNFVGKTLLATLTMLTFAVPGTVVGIGYILAFNRPPLALTGTALIIILLFVFRSLPLVVEAGSAAIRQIDPGIEEGSASLGATPLATFRRVVLPICAPALFAGIAQTFVRSLTAISAVIFVVSGRWNLLTVSILGYVENGELSRAAALCVLLVAIVSLILAVVSTRANEHVGDRYRRSR